MREFKLQRFAWCLEQGTFGRLLAPNGEQLCYTVELPWRDNQRSVSCIPAGTYILRVRPSKVVEETSGGMYEAGWEVTNVEGRDFIMLHPGNSIDDLEGCIAPGEELSGWNGRWTVTNSRDTFAWLMDDVFPQAGDMRLTIFYDPGEPG